jgi:hypothetical protein
VIIIRGIAFLFSTVKGTSSSKSRDAAIQALEDASTRAAERQLRREEVASVWERAKHWLESALEVGVFVVHKAEVLQELVRKTTKLLS